jgi:hypothetical protein
MSYMSSIHHLSVKQLLQAADLKEKIAGLEKQLEQLLGTKAAPIATSKPVVKKGGISAAGKARIVAAQKLRWAKINAAKAKTAPVAKLVPATTKPAKKFTMSSAAKAKISAAAKLRWARVKATKPAAKPKASPTPKKKGGMSAAGRAKISAAAKARWAKAKAAGKKSL